MNAKHPLLLHVAVFILTCSWVSSGHAQAECSLIELRCIEGLTDEERTSTEPIGALYCGRASVSYDLVAGKLRVEASGAGDLGMFGQVNARDTYWVMGVPAGTHLTFRADLVVVGTAEASSYCNFGTSTGQFRALIEVLGNDSDSVSGYRSCQWYVEGCLCSGDEWISTTLSVEVEHVVGEEFGLFLGTTASATWGSATVAADLSFSGLPQGASIASCQGFMYEVPVQTVMSSWGSIKALYR